MSDRFIKDITDTIDKALIRPLVDAKLVQNNQLGPVYECFAFLRETPDIIFIILDELFKLYLRYKTPNQTDDFNQMIKDLKKNDNSLQDKLKRLNIIPDHIQNYIVKCYNFVALRYAPNTNTTTNNDNNNSEIFHSL